MKLSLVSSLNTVHGTQMALFDSVPMPKIRDPTDCGRSTLNGGQLDNHSVVVYVEEHHRIGYLGVCGYKYWTIG